MAKLITLNVYLGEEANQTLEKLHKQTGMSRAKIIREGIELFRQKIEADTQAGA